jgi:hypothetical protein
LFDPKGNSLNKSITIYKKDTNFWDDFFIISILPLKKTTKKKVTTVPNY